MKGTIFSLKSNSSQSKRSNHSARIKSGGLFLLFLGLLGGCNRIKTAQTFTETGIVRKAREEIAALKAVDPADNLSLISRIYLPAENPKGLQPLFSVNEEGLMVTYMNLMKSDRIFGIHQQYSSDPLKLLKAKAKSLSTKQIGEELFYVSGDPWPEELKNIYMIREDLMIQITAQGFSEAEFIKTLEGLIEIPLDSNHVAPNSTK